VSIKEWKEAVHEVLQEGAQRMPLAGDALVVKFAVVMECAMPDGSHAIFRLDADAGGRDLYPWETTGLFHTALLDNYPRGGPSAPSGDTD
jgi:hypothetical protein